MKLIYCIASVYNPGGMERVLLNKLRWFVRRGGYDLTVVTTDQQGRPPFYAFPSEVKLVDLGINYSQDNSRSPLSKILHYFRKRRLHRSRLTAFLMQERADAVVSLFPSESSFIPEIKDGSLKVLELHFNKFFRLQYNRRGLLGLADRFRTRQDEKLVRRFDRFVVLTREDAGYWGKLPNLRVIPNAVSGIPPMKADVVLSRRVIAVGRLDYQKGFDRLLAAWALLPAELRASWRLDIYGQGEWDAMLREQIQQLAIGTSAAIHAPTPRIFEEYAQSAFLVMSSHYEGLPMVMIEAMSCGLPVVSFDFPCGPRDLICDGENGLLVREGDIRDLAKAMERLMNGNDQRFSMGTKASNVRSIYDESHIMQKWTICFQTTRE